MSRSQMSFCSVSTGVAVFHRQVLPVPRMIAWAKQLGRNDCASVLQKTLDEEKATDQKLTKLADSRVNLRAAS